MDKIPVVAVVGPTASGKTALAAELCVRLGGEVISADSMQIYRHMDIATAKPTEEEKRGVPHHLLDFLEPDEEFSVARYCELAHAAASDIHSRGALPVIAGGTGLYIDSFLNNIDFADVEPDPELRESLRREAEEKGVDQMLDELRSFDPESADRLAHGRNMKRIVRAIEVYRATGRTATEMNAVQTSAESPYRYVKIGLRAHDRDYLYDRINQRVDKMMCDGLFDEARRFYERGYGSTAAAAIGYKELLPYLRGELELEVCVERLKQATRRYAKRQLTWFGRDPEIHWFEIDRCGFDDIADKSEQIIKDCFYE